MVELSKLFVTIGAKTDQFEKGLKRVSKQMKGVALGMVAIGAGIALALGKAGKDFAELGDQMQKMALRTGFSTEALSELKFAAEISGASLETLEKGVKRMSAAIVDADNGLLETKRAFDELNLSASRLLELSPEEAFFEIAGAIGDLENATIRAATAQDIFGRAGTQLLPLMAEGAAGIEALRKEARELGIVFDQEAANAAAAFNDALTRLKGAVDGIKVTIGTELAPILTDLIDEFTENTKKVTEWTKKNPALTNVLIKFSGVMGGILLSLGGLVLIAPSIITVVTTMGIAASAAAIGFVALAAGIALITFCLIGLAKNAEQRAVVAEIEAEQTKFLAGETNNLAEVLEDALAKGYVIATDKIVDFIAASKDMEVAEAGQAEATLAAADALNVELDALLALERAKRDARGQKVQQAASLTSAILAAGGLQGPGEAAQFISELTAPGGQFGPNALPEPEVPSGLGLPDRIIIENSIVLDGEVVGRSVNDLLGHMVDDRQRVEGESP